MQRMEMSEININVHGYFENLMNVENERGGWRTVIESGGAEWKAVGSYDIPVEVWRCGLLGYHNLSE